MAKVSKRHWTTAKGEERTAWRLDFTDASGTRRREQFGTRRQAEARRVEVEGQIRSGTFRPESSSTTVREVAEAYLDHARGRMERRERFTRHHLAVVSGHVRNHILHPVRGIGAMKLGEVTTGAVNALRDRLRSAGVSVATTRKVLSTLHAIVEFAIACDLLAVNPARGVRVIGRRDEGSVKVVPPSKDAMRRLVEVADPDFRVLLMVAALTGVRAGELHAVRWRHINFEAMEVTVETRVDAYGDEDVTKTAAGMRTIPISDDLVSELKAWKIRSRFSRSDDLVFPNNRGLYESHDNMVKRRFRPLFDQLASMHDETPNEHPPAPEPFRWHALRHFAVSTWIEQGCSQKEVQEMAGHSSLQITMDRYGHMFPSERNREKMKQASGWLHG